MSYKFIDLLAGIGGFRSGFEKHGCECVYSSEIDTHAQEMSGLNYGDRVHSDITQIDEKDFRVSNN